MAPHSPIAWGGHAAARGRAGVGRVCTRVVFAPGPPLHGDGPCWHQGHACAGTGHTGTRAALAHSRGCTRVVFTQGWGPFAPASRLYRNQGAFARGLLLHRGRACTRLRLHRDGAHLHQDGVCLHQGRICTRAVFAPGWRSGRDGVPFARGPLAHQGHACSLPRSHWGRSGFARGFVLSRGSRGAGPRSWVGWGHPSAPRRGPHRDALAAGWVSPRPGPRPGAVRGAAPRSAASRPQREPFGVGGGGGCGGGGGPAAGHPPRSDLAPATPGLLAAGSPHGGAWLAAISRLQG